MHDADYSRQRALARSNGSTDRPRVKIRVVDERDAKNGGGEIKTGRRGALDARARERTRTPPAGQSARRRRDRRALELAQWSVASERRQATANDKDEQRVSERRAGARARVQGGSRRLFASLEDDRARARSLARRRECCFFCPLGGRDARELLLQSSDDGDCKRQETIFVVVVVWHDHTKNGLINDVEIVCVCNN